MAVDKKRALTDETYRNSLTADERAELDAMVTEEELDQISGGAQPAPPKGPPKGPGPRNPTTNIGCR